MRPLLYIVSFCLVLMPMATADNYATQWQKQGAVQARVIIGQGAEMPLAGVQLRLAKGWHTYWKDAGASGIAPSFDWSGSVHLRSHEPLFATPTRFFDDLGDYYGYKEEVVFLHPLTFTRDKADLKLTLDFGICETICIPLRFVFALTEISPPHTPTPYQSIIKDALTRLPQAPSATLRVERAEASDNTLHLYVRSPAKPAVIVSGTEEDYFARPTITQQGAGYVALVPSTTPLQGRTLEVILRSGVLAVSQKVVVK